MVFVLKKDVCDEFELNAARLSKLQALVDKKRIVITEEVVCEILQLDDAEGQRFYFSKYIFESLVRNVNSTSKFYMYPRVRKGFSGVDTPLFENMLTVRAVDAEEEVQKVGTSQRVESSEDVENVFNQGRISVDMETNEGIKLEVDQEKDAEIEGRQADTQAEIYNIDLDHSSKVAAASAPIPAAKPKVLKIAATAPTVSTRRRKGVVIRDPEEELHTDTPAKTPTVKDKGKGILIEDPKPMKKKDQIEMDAEYAKKLQEELEKKHEEAYKQIDWNAAFDHTREEMEKEDEEIIKSINETPAQKAAKRRKLSEEAQEADDLRGRLDIVQDKDDDVFVEAIPLARKVPVVDYQASCGLIYLASRKLLISSTTTCGRLVDEVVPVVDVSYSFGKFFLHRVLFYVHEADGYASPHGGPRYMYGHYLDVLAIFRAHENPLFFITYTCNIKWPEITDYMAQFPLLSTTDIADVIDRVFKMKIHQFINVLRNADPFGKTVADRTLRDLLDEPNRLFGGKTVMLGGDFRQTQPVKKNASRNEVIQSSIAKSYIWRHFTIHYLTENMRLNNERLQEADRQRIPAFAQWLLDVGNRDIGTSDDFDPENSSWIDIPDDYCIPDDENETSNLINFIYDDETLRTIATTNKLDSTHEGMGMMIIASPEITAILDLTPTHYNKTIKAIVYRKWTCKHMETRQTMKYCCILMDKQVQDYSHHLASTSAQPNSSMHFMLENSPDIVAVAVVSAISNNWLHRGLRQGDPLSPLLFIIAKEGLHIAMEDAKATGLFHGLNLDNIGLHLSHLLYAADVIFMGECLVGFNIELILKLWWRFVNNESMLWVRVIKSIYGNQCGFDHDNPRVSGLQPWARILSLISRLKARNVVRQYTLQRKIRDGTSTKLWHDCWLNGISLATQYTRLYSLETHKDCVVSEKWNLCDGWIWSWRRKIRGGIEQSQFQSLMERLQSFSCSRNVDSWNWNPDPSGDFTIKYTRRWLDDIILPMNLSVTRWNPLVPRNVNIFCW
nr:DNA helicase [Tanacetum cinerariifolium]